MGLKWDLEWSRSFEVSQPFDGAFLRVDACSLARRNIFSMSLWMANWLMASASEL